MQLWQTGGKIIHKGVFRTKDTSIMRILPWDDPKQDQNSFRRSSTLKRARYSPPDHLPKLSYRNGGGYRVAYTKSVRGADAVVELCRDNVLGFDMEWRPQFQRGKKENKTALIQLCSKNIIGLFHVIHMQEFPSALRTILEDPDIKKSGLNIAGDANKLYRDYGVSLAGHLDVGHIAKSIPISMDRCTLQELVHRMLGSYLDKSDRIRMGNWARYSLDAAQREYAATDVYASYKVYCALLEYQARQKQEDGVNVSSGSVSGEIGQPVVPEPLKPVGESSSPQKVHWTSILVTSRAESARVRSRSAGSKIQTGAGELIRTEAGTIAHIRGSPLVDNAGDDDKRGDVSS